MDENSLEQLRRKRKGSKVHATWGMNTGQISREEPGLEQEDQGGRGACCHKPRELASPKGHMVPDTKEKAEGIKLQKSNNVEVILGLEVGNVGGVMKAEIRHQQVLGSELGCKVEKGRDM